MASSTACISGVQAVVTITVWCWGKTTQNCPKAPSPRYPCRDIQNWKP